MLRADGRTVEGPERICRELGLRVVEGPIRPGDLYIGERNTGPHLLTCLRVVDGPFGPSYIVPKENAYPYDAWECVKVEEIPSC